MEALVNGKEADARLLVADLEVDLGRKSVVRAGEIIKLPNLSFRVLEVLLLAAPKLVSHDELIEQAWGPKRIISPENLTQRIKLLRESLGDDPRSPVYIESVRGQGFRILPKVEEVIGTLTPATDSPAGQSLSLQDDQSPRVPMEERSRAPGMLVAAVAVIVLSAWWVSTYLVRHEGSVTHGGDAELSQAARVEDSIAVLAFQDMSENQDQTYLADGLAEELLNLLAGIPSLRVTARTSAFSFKNKDLTIPEIGEILNVAHILEGSVRRQGDKLRITAQLIEVATDAHVWSKTYTRELDDIFSLQDEIAAQVVAQLKVTLVNGTPRAQPLPSDMYPLYLQARHLTNQYTADARKRAAELCKEVLSESPSYAPCIMIIARNIPTREAGPLVEQILAGDPDYAPAVAARGFAAFMLEGDLPKGVEYVKRAFDINSADPTVLMVGSKLQQTLGRPGFDLFNFIIARDPINALAYVELSSAYYMARQWQDSIDAARTAISLSPDTEMAHWLLSAGLLAQGSLDAALAAAEQEKSEKHRLIQLSVVHHARGQKEASDAALEELIRKYGHKGAADNIGPYFVAWPLSIRGEVDQAFDYLEMALEIWDAGLYGILGNPCWDNLKSDPRWDELLVRLNRSPEQLAGIDLQLDLPR